MRSEKPSRASPGIDLDNAKTRRRFYYWKPFNLSAEQIEGDALSISDVDEFKSNISDAAAIEMYSLSNEMIRLEIIFNNIIKED